MKPGASQGSPLAGGPRGLQGQRAGSDDGRHSFGSCCPEDVAVACRLLRESDLYRASDEHYYICLGRRPGAPKWVPGWRGWWGGGGGGGGGESLELFLDKVADMPVVVHVVFFFEPFHPASL